MDRGDKHYGSPPAIVDGHIEIGNEDDDDADRFESYDEALHGGGGNDDLLDEFHRTVQDLFEDEEALLNLHMNVIQENAELLTEEGRLLTNIQGDDNDIDAYAQRLDTILVRKQELITVLRDRLTLFRHKLAQEEATSKKVSQCISAY